MRKIKVIISLSKISLLSLILVMAVQFSGLIGNARTTAFFTSAVEAEANPLTAGDWTPPNHPLFWVEEDSGEVKIGWILDPEVAIYHIYRSLNNVTYTEIGNTNSSTDFFIDDDVMTNVDYYYKVTASDTADNQSDLTAFLGKKATPKDVVIDDHARTADHNDSGTTSLTGTWGAYHTYQNGYPQQVLQNALGGDNFSTTNSSGQTFTWTTGTALDGKYDVFVQYICDPSRGIGRYDVLASGLKINVSPITIYQNRNDGLSSSPLCAAQSTVSVAGAQWVKLGTFTFFNQTASITLVAQTGERNILADGVAFSRIADASLDTPVNEGWNLKTESLTPDERELDLVCGAVTNGGNPSAPLVAQNWTPVSGVGVRYQREVTYPNGNVKNTFYETNPFTPFVSLGSISGIEGLWRTRVRAFFDRNSDNQASPGIDTVSGWSNYCDITLDKTPPVTIASVSNSPIKPMEQRFKNGDFEIGTLSGWSTDENSQVQVITGDEHVAQAHQGRFMAKIGTDNDSDGQSINVNLLSQDIPAGVRSIRFYYNFFTTDVAPFDEPGMMVFVNDKQVQQIWARDINVSGDESGKAYSSGWRHMNIYVGDVENGTLTIAFYAGNDDTDDQRQSWLYVDEVSTLDLVVNEHALFNLQVDGQPTGVTTYYQIGGGDPQTGNQFSLGATPFEGTIKYWSVDMAGNTESDHVFWVANDNQAPSSISDVEVIDEGDGEYTLNFSAPSDNLFPAVSEYDIRYSSTPIIDGTDWNALPVADRVVISAPRYAGQPESILVKGLNADTHYFFAIKSADAARNWSLISNISEVNGEPYVEILQQDSSSAQLKLFNVKAFEKATYVLTYTHMLDDMLITEGMTDTVEVLGKSSVEINDLYLGTCSEAGVVCTPHQDISEVKAVITLINHDSSTQQIEYAYPVNWIEGP